LLKKIIYGNIWEIGGVYMILSRLWKSKLSLTTDYFKARGLPVVVFGDDVSAVMAGQFFGLLPLVGGDTFKIDETRSVTYISRDGGEEYLARKQLSPKLKKKITLTMAQSLKSIGYDETSNLGINKYSKEEATESVGKVGYIVGNEDDTLLHLTIGNRCKIYNLIKSRKRMKLQYSHSSFENQEKNERLRSMENENRHHYVVIGDKMEAMISIFHFGGEDKDSKSYVAEEMLENTLLASNFPINATEIFKLINSSLNKPIDFYDYISITIKNVIDEEKRELVEEFEVKKGKFAVLKRVLNGNVITIEGDDSKMTVSNIDSDTLAEDVIATKEKVKTLRAIREI